MVTLLRVFMCVEHNYVKVFSLIKHVEFYQVDGVVHFLRMSVRVFLLICLFVSGPV